MRYNLLIVLCLGLCLTGAAEHAGCVDGEQESGALYRICMPEGQWNGNLIIYDHGYTSALDPIDLPAEFTELPFSISVDRVFTGLGYAFAGSSYSTNGLAVQEGMADTIDLLDIFSSIHGEPDRVYLLGISMGGLVATLLGEQRPDLFDAVLCGCAPVGDFQAQINWFGDFRVAFDYFFPWMLPGSPTQVPRALQDLWPLYYDWFIHPNVFQPINAEKLQQLAAITNARIDPERPEETFEQTLQILLWYNVFSTNDAKEKLGGQPYDNMDRQYGGIPNAFVFNGLVDRYRADPVAQAEIAARYQTTGALQVPYVSLHTTLDPLVPYEQVEWYRQKVTAQGTDHLFTHFPTEQYGHCFFGLPEVVAALGLVVRDVEGPAAAAFLIEQALQSPVWGLSDREEFRGIATEYGLEVPPKAPAVFPLLELLLALVRRLFGGFIGF